MKKRSIIIVCAIVLITIILVIIKKYSGPKLEEAIIDSLVNNGYTLNEETDIYEKFNIDLTQEEYGYNVSNGTNTKLDMFKFNSEDLTLTEIVSEYDDEINYDLTMTYDYISKSFFYTYRISDNENINIIITGRSPSKYEIEYEYGNGNIDVKDIYDSIKEDLYDFKTEYLNIISSNTLRELIEKKREEAE